ncbi:MAG: type IV conjugative transfer system protein TraL [Nitrospirota bacterium]
MGRLAAIRVWPIAAMAHPLTCWCLMYTIPRYIDSPPQVLWWELDEIVILIICIFAGIISRELTTLTAVGICSTILISKTKRGKSEGIVLHWCYWHCLPMFSLKGCPSGDVRELVE